MAFEKKSQVRRFLEGVLLEFYELSDKETRETLEEVFQVQPHEQANQSAEHYLNMTRGY